MQISVGGKEIMKINMSAKTRIMTRNWYLGCVLDEFRTGDEKYKIKQLKYIQSI